MSNTGIKTYDDLARERIRLEALLVVQKQRVVDDWQSVKNELEPVNQTFDAIGKLAHPDKTNPLLNMGLKFASDIFLKNFVLAKAGWVTRLAIPFVMKNYSSHFLADNGKGVLDKLRSLGNIFKRKNSHHEPGQEDTEFGEAEQNSEYRQQ